MYSGLIDHLTFIYSFICKGRGRIPGQDLGAISNGTHAVVKNAPDVLMCGDRAPQDELDLLEADKIMRHIDEMIIFFNTTEIV